MSEAEMPILPPSREDPETLPFISAVEILAIFSKHENLSSILPQATFDLTTRAGREAAKEATKGPNVVTPRASTTTTRARGGRKEKEKEEPHGECSVVEKVRKEMLEKIKGVTGLRGLL